LVAIWESGLLGAFGGLAPRLLTLAETAASGRLPVTGATREERVVYWVSFVIGAIVYAFIGGVTSWASAASAPPEHDLTPLNLILIGASAPSLIQTAASAARNT
jgi:hypothetical protein